LLLLSVWMWERFPVGRAKAGNHKTWEDHGDPLRWPTWTYLKWDTVVEFTGDPQTSYETYTNEFDELTPQQVLILLLC